MILGNLSDRYGRKPVLIISQAGTLLSWLIFGLAWVVGEYYGAVLWSLLIIGFARFTDGVTGGNSTVSNAYLSDVLPSDKRAVAFGYVGAVLGLGIVIGPAIGAYTSATSIGYLGMVIFSIILSTVTLIAIAFKLRESLAIENRVSSPFSHTNGDSKVHKMNLVKNFLDQINIFKALAYFKDRKIIISVFISKLFVSGALAANSTTIMLLLIDRFNFNQTEIGIFLLAVGAFVILNQIFIVKIFIRRVGEVPTLFLGLLFVSLGLFTFPILDNLWLFITFYYFTNLGINLSFPTIRSISSREATKKEQGRVMGIDESIFSLSMAVIPVIAATAYNFLEWKAFLIWGFGTLIGAALFFTQNRKLIKLKPTAITEQSTS